MSTSMSPALAAKVWQSRAILSDAVKRHSPRGVVGMFSGGHDSLCATHIASQHAAFRGAAHMNTTIGIEATREFVRRVSMERQWRLREYRPPVSYRDIVLKHGFPGPGSHLFMYTRLKERCVRQLMRDLQHRPGDRVALVTGVRLAESTRRMGHVKPVQKEGGKLWVAPILHWTDDDKNEYMAFHGLPRNPVVDQLCMSGECLCGAFASPGEIAEIEAAFPVVAAEIRALEAEARAAGVHAVWGTRPPSETREPKRAGPMCHSCEAKRAA